MKKLLLCVLTVMIFASSAIGGGVQDLFSEIMNIAKTYKSDEERMLQAGKLITVERIRAITESGEDINVKGEGGITLLMACVVFGDNPEVVDILLKAGADVNAKDNYGRNALFLALFGYTRRPANPEIIRMLAEAGSDITVKWNGHTVRELAAKSRNPEIRKMAYTLLTNGSGPVQNLLGEVMHVMATPRVSWEKRGEQIRNIVTPERVKSIIDSGADVNAKGEQGITLLMVAAAFSDNPGIVSSLLRAGADVNARVYGSSTILMQTVIHSQNPEIVRLLIDAGADVDAKDSEGFTAGHLAKGNKNPEIRAMFSARD